MSKFSHRGMQLGIPLLGGGAGVVLPFDQQVLALPGFAAGWWLDETSGTTAVEIGGNTALNGTYGGTRTLAGAVFPVLNPVMQANAGFVTLPHTDLLALTNWSKGWWLGFCKFTTPALTDGSRKTLFQLRLNSQEVFYVDKFATAYSMFFDFFTGGTRKAAEWFRARDQWQMFAITWDVAGNALKLYIDGVLMQTFTSLGTPAGGAAVSPSAFIGTGNGVMIGGIGYHAFGAGDIPTEEQLNSVWQAVRPVSREITWAGDSKSNNNDWWQTLLLRALETATGDIWRERCREFATAGWRVANLKTALQSDLASTLGSPEVVLVNIGTNDQSAGTSESSFKADLTACIDAYRSKFPDANIYIAFPYRSDVATPTSPATMKAWIQDVIDGYSSRVFAGIDETVWFANDIATFSDDNLHYNAAGSEEAKNQWQLTLGY